MTRSIGGTRAYGDRPCPDRRYRTHQAPSKSTVRFARLIPVYPKEITRTELRAKTGLPDGQLASLISAVGNHYLLCQDGDRFSLLRRGRANVD